MLEHSQLLLQGWTKKPLPEGGLAWVRTIADASDHLLGFVRLDGVPAASWFSWFRKVRLDVFETEDASHLLTITRSWGVLQIWEVDDAEGRHVGTIHTKNIVSSEGGRLAYFDPQPGDQGRILDPVGRVLARFAKKPGGVWELTFTPEPATNPFLRMLALGSVLTMEAVPKAT